MDDKTVDFQDKIRSFDREVRQWGVYEWLKSNIEKFRVAKPLIMDLRDEAMREAQEKN